MFFFDEAHLLFDDAPKALVERIEQAVRLIPSKGARVYFVSQIPLDIPEDVLGQLGNRFQHALRAFTPKGQRAVRAAADPFRPNPIFQRPRSLKIWASAKHGFNPRRERRANYRRTNVDSSTLIAAWSSHNR